MTYDNEMQALFADLSDNSCLFNEIAGTSEDYSKEAIESQLKIILSEVEELVTAFNEETPTDVAAEAVDVVVTVIGLLQKLNNAGIDCYTIAKRIGEKNLEKFPSSLALVEASIKDYTDKGIKVTAVANTEYFTGKYVIRDEHGKVRKPLGFTKVNLSDCGSKELQYGFIGKQ